MECGHFFCNDCWRGHFRVQISEGNSRRIKCMQDKCNTICDEEKVGFLLATGGLRSPCSAAWSLLRCLSAARWPVLLLSSIKSCLSMACSLSMSECCQICAACTAEHCGQPATLFSFS